MSNSLETLTTMTNSAAVISLCYLIAGGLAGSIALTILYPIEQLNTRKTVADQSTARIITINTIIDDFLNLHIDNILDIYRGLQFGIFSKFMFNGIYFFFYSLLKNSLTKQYSTTDNTHHIPIIAALFIGCIAGILTQIFTLPLSTIQKILQTTKGKDKLHSDPFMIINNVKQRHGISAFWSGFVTNIILVINPAINIYCYEQTRQYLNILFGFKSGIIDFLAGLFSKIIATIICYPLIYIKYIQQVDNTCDKKQHVLNIVVNTYNRYGIRKFYSGLTTKILQSSLNNALMFMIKEKIVIYTFTMVLYIFIHINFKISSA